MVQINMRNIILIFLVSLITGCATVPPYTGPALPPLAQGVAGIHHRVKAGQTLWKIAKLYAVDIDDILRLNHLPEDAVIETGRLLLIPNRARPQNFAVSSGSDDFIWPLKGRVIAGFGSNYQNLINRGINIQASMGDNILAARSGRVVFYADHFGNFGKTIIIDHGDGLRSVYSRVLQALVRPGDNVHKGALIGRSGTSARDRSAYLHFEIRKGALAQNPLFYLP